MARDMTNLSGILAREGLLEQRTPGGVQHVIAMAAITYLKGIPVLSTTQLAAAFLGTAHLWPEALRRTLPNNRRTQRMYCMRSYNPCLAPDGIPSGILRTKLQDLFGAGRITYERDGDLWVPSMLGLYFTNDEALRAYLAPHVQPNGDGGHILRASANLLPVEPRVI